MRNLIWESNEKLGGVGGEGKTTTKRILDIQKVGWEDGTFEGASKGGIRDAGDGHRTVSVGAKTSRTGPLFRVSEKGTELTNDPPQRRRGTMRGNYTNHPVVLGKTNGGEWYRFCQRIVWGEGQSRVKRLALWVRVGGEKQRKQNLELGGAEVVGEDKV